MNEELLDKLKDAFRCTAQELLGEITQDASGYIKEISSEFGRYLLGGDAANLAELELQIQMLATKYNIQLMHEVQERVVTVLSQLAKFALKVLL